MTAFQIVFLVVWLQVAALVPAIIYTRRWLQRQPDALAAHYRFCSIVMAAGFLLLAEGAVGEVRTLVLRDTSGPPLGKAPGADF